ncbi:alpha/beta hydrolase [Actibacterium pelagium]|uniref:Esterase n=1 Tax=Actibacterium pelagium TaxID=2029103 RepID=A0A917EGY0_9RHOB|nr:alpha/beta hydrolase [Actibacterium pelagium]GGE38216.1 esterase [Actibacterium pelagium]
MIDGAGIDWEDAFLNAPYIPDGMTFPELWRTRAEAFRQQAKCELDVPYGDHPRERLDLFFPEGPSKGLAVIVHGGFWLKFDKSSWSDLAEGALAHGWTVAMPSYVLAPEATLPEITEQVAQAISVAASRVEGPIRLSGHSAGGHLVTRMVCNDTPLTTKTAGRIERVVSISGLHDLRPLLLHSMNENLRLDANSAAAESAALCTALPDVKVTAWVGACERPEFLRQSALLVAAWGRQGVPIDLVTDPKRHHFDVIEGLKSADHPLTTAFAGD